MEIRETLNSALSAIFANRLRSSLTILGIVIGVTSVIVLVSIVSGLKTFITSQIEGLGSNLIFVIPGRVGGARSPGGVQVNRLVLSDAASLRNKLSEDADVSAVVQRNAALKYANKLDRGVSVFGVEANYPKLILIKLKDGRFFTNPEAESGKRIAVVGTSVVAALFGNQEAIGKTIDISGLKYQVLGVAQKRGSIFGIDQDNSVLIPLPAAQRQFGIDRLNTIYISAKRPSDVKTVQSEAAKVLKKRLSEDEFSVLTQEQALSTISQVTRVLTLALGGISAISLVVGGVGIMNIMLVSVTERTREIGLRKALGARPKDIRNQFLIEAATLSLAGGILGVVFGILFSLVINQFIQTSITWWSVILSLGVSMLVGVIFGIAPALRASRLDPIQALRYE